ncbi:hypothetical protein TTHERM_000470591 (macronuclear) [Tetrahymena thermophila SB210]|uniref:Transmembrane protein n=1 Tax=Tetrahymena thermophila (strain SB210) TaxID=312017 RepID=W7X7H3_TETTS|nr:hypothetical protein TTHERM_000470591 [Tetrahymena thermophila SB210]EWS73302.1 hypothetical protein TTHERM_000470591 [Tetrahymena thermophila SB210]|eukprot:XP_012654151.1 hypothetical protein TTHERM_000470591 [Tetrahymena thermophila SB210]
MNIQTIHQPSNFVTVSQNRINNHNIYNSRRQVVQNLSPVLYKNMQIQQNKVLIPTSIRSTSPQQSQTILRQSYQLLQLPIQSLRTSKPINQSFTPPNRQFLTDRERTTNSFHQKNQKVLTNDQKNHNYQQISISLQNSPNVSRVNRTNQQYAGQQSNMQSLLKIQQTFEPLRQNEQLTKQETKINNNNSYKKDFSSLQSSYNYRSTQMTESDQDILNIVSKYIGNKTNVNYQSIKGSNTYSNQQLYDDLELAYSQHQFNLSQKSQQYYSSSPNQLDYQINKSCSYPEEMNCTSQSKHDKEQQQVENHRQQISQISQNQDIQSLSCKDQNSNYSVNNSIESQKEINYEQMVLINTEHNKQQQIAIQEQINLIKLEKYQINSQNINQKNVSQSNQMLQQQDIKENDDIYQHNIPSLQQNYQTQQNNQKVPTQNEIQKQILLNQNVEFTECSDNHPNNQNSFFKDDEQEKIESDDRLNLAVYEDDNQIFDIISSDKLEESNKQQNKNQFLENDDDKNNILSSSLEKVQLKSSKLSQNNAQILDPIQEEDFLSRSSFDTATIKKQLSGSFTTTQNLNQISGENFNNQINEKIELQNRDVPFVIEQELKQQVNQILNQNLIQPIEQQELKNTKNEVLDDDIQLFDSNLEEIDCIIQKGCEDNLFSQDSYENYLDIYNSDTNNNKKETYQTQKNLAKQEHQRSQSDATNYSQNFQSISSFDNESLRRSIGNLASFGHSPQISIQTNEQTYLNGNSATFNYENTQNSEQSPEVQSKQKLSQLIAESEKCQKIETPQIQNQETPTLQFEIKETKSTQKKLTFQDAFVLIALFLLVILIGCIFIIFIQDNSLVKFTNYYNQDIYEGQQQFDQLQVYNYDFINLDYECQSLNAYQFFLQNR